MINCPGCYEQNGVFTIMGEIAHFYCRYCGCWYKTKVSNLTEYWEEYEYPNEYND